MAKLVNLALTQGEDKTFRLTVTDENDAAIDITGATLTFTAEDQQDQTSGAWTFTKALTLITPASGIADLVLLDTETALWPSLCDLPYDIWIQQASGARNRVVYGVVNVGERITVL